MEIYWTPVLRSMDVKDDLPFYFCLSTLIWSGCPRRYAQALLTRRPALQGTCNIFKIISTLDLTNFVKIEWMESYCGDHCWSNDAWAQRWSSGTKMNRVRDRRIRGPGCITLDVVHITEHHRPLWPVPLVISFQKLLKGLKIFVLYFSDFWTQWINLERKRRWTGEVCTLIHKMFKSTENDVFAYCQKYLPL